MFYSFILTNIKQRMCHFVKEAHSIFHKKSYYFLIIVCLRSGPNDTMRIGIASSFSRNEI